MDKTFRKGNTDKLILYLFWKGVYSKKEEFAPLENNSSLLEKTPFHKEFGAQKSKEVTLVKNGGKYTKYIKSLYLSMPMGVDNIQFGSNTGFMYSNLDNFTFTVGGWIGTAKHSKNSMTKIWYSYNYLF